MAVIENPRRLGHLDHERALTAGQFVAGADAGENAVGQADRGFACRHKAADLGHERQQRHLADVGALARHVRAGDQQDLAASVASVRGDRHILLTGHRKRASPPWSPQRIVGTNVPLRKNVQHRMPAVDDPQHRLFDASRPAIAALPGQCRQGRQHVQLRQYRGRRLQSLRARRPSLRAARRTVRIPSSLACSSAVSTFSSYSFSSGVM